jgi:threonyl-tRNA synthetase
VAKEHLQFCDSLLTQLSANQIRADIDDREESVGKKIRESETEWTRYTVVVGDKEVGSGKLMVRDRLEGKQREMTVQELIEEIKAQVKDKPYLPLNLPTYVSTRPQIMA